jgi:hypothetical protein
MIDYTTLLKKLTPDRDGEPHTHLRTAVVDAENADGTVDLEMSGGVIVPNVSKLDSARVAVGTVVQVISFRGSLLVLGPVSAGAISNGSGGVTAFNSNNPTTSSTTFTALAGGDILGVAFIAPPSGSVEVVVQGWLALNSATVGRRTLMSPQIREGSSIDAGTVAVAASDDYSALAQNSVASSFDYKYVYHSRIATGLVSGDPYNAVAMHRILTGGDSCATNERHIIVKPF